MNETAQQRLAEIKKYLMRIVEGTNTAEKDFADRLARDGVLEAFRWRGEDLLRKAQKRVLAQHVLGGIDANKRPADEKIEFLTTYTIREALQRARLVNGPRTMLDSLSVLAAIEFWGELAEFLGAIPDFPTES